jgi:hypothetical protein
MQQQLPFGDDTKNATAKATTTAKTTAKYRDPSLRSG